MPVLSVTGVNVVEGNGGSQSVTFTLSLDVAPTAPVTVEYYLQDVTASSGNSDYGPNSGLVTFSTGQTSKTITVTIYGDALVEGDETFHLVLANVEGATFLGNHAAMYAVGKIIDNDNGPPSGSGGVGPAGIGISGPTSAHASLPTARVSDVAQIEGNGATNYVRFLVTLDKVPTAPVTISYYFQDGTASSGNGDFQPDSGTLTFAAGEQSKWITTWIDGDTIDEANETFDLVLAKITGGVFEGNAAALIATATIIDNDGGAPDMAAGIGGPGDQVQSPTSAHASLPTIRVYDVSQIEGNGGTNYVRFLVTLDKTPTAPVTVNYYFQDGTASSALGDFQPDSGTLTFAAGERSAWITTWIDGDTTIEDNETFQLVLTTAEGGVFEGGATALIATGTIIDNDSGAPTLVGGVGGPGDQVPDPVSAHASLPTITVHNVSQFEGNGGTNYVRFLVTLDKPPTAPVSLSYYFQDGSASSANGDFQPDSGTLNFAAGEQSKWITTWIDGDTKIEANETFHLVLANASGGVFVGGAASLIATATIVEDDAGAPTLEGGVGGGPELSADPLSAHASLPTVSISDVSQFEGNSGTNYVRFLVTLDKAPTSPVTFYWSTQDGTASASDYQPDAGMVTIAAGQRSTWITTWIDGDTLIEENETFHLILSTISGGVFAGNAPVLIATGTIIENDNGDVTLTAGVGDDAERAVPPAAVGGLPTIRLVSTSINEGNSGAGTANVYFVLSHAATTNIQFRVTTNNGTAQSSSPTDYGAASNVLVTIPAGTVSGYLSLTVYGDTLIEGDENFTVTLSALTANAAFEGGGATLSATVTIRDNDGTGTAGTVEAGPQFVISPTSGADNIPGTTGDDVLDGLGGNDTLTGGPGNDLFMGGLGADSMSGGDGVDTVSYAASASRVRVNLLTNVGLDAQAAGDTWSGIENVIGSNFNDIIVGNAAANVITGGTGADAMTGGAGNDTYYVDNAGDTTVEVGNGGYDTVYSSINWQVSNYIEALILTGSAINGTGNGTQNTITGTSANNVLDGKASGDTLIGGLGNDIYVVDHVNDVVVELANEGTDTVKAFNNHVLGANVENLTMDGTAANGGGNALNNTIKGNDVNNIITGGDGNDLLAGGLGNDRLTGGNGLDAFVFNTAPNNTTNRDQIVDFSVADDTIRLDNAVFTSLGANGVLNAAFFRIGTAAADGNDYIIYNSAAGALFYDADGNGAGAAIRFATISTGLAMTNADFLVI